MKLGKRIISLVLALVMVFGLTTGVSAATAQNIKVQLSPNITVKLNGETQSMTDVNGNPVYPLLNDGTTYVPIRAISNMLGIEVAWDGATQTVILMDPAGGRKPAHGTGGTSTKPAPSTVTVQLSPGITVKYNGKVQAMTDVNGNPVYPMLYGGTTYLPIRAVANMLNINVGWDGATQTVYLAQPRSSGTDSSTESNNMTTVTFDNPSVERIRKSMEMFKYPEEAIESAIAEFVATGPNGENGTFIYAFEPSKKDTFKTSEGAIVLGDKHLDCGYAEVDYSMADDGYVKVKLTASVWNDPSSHAFCNIDWVNASKSLIFMLELDQWTTIPLLGGSDDYQLSIWPTGILAMPFYVTFAANIEDPDAFALLSNPRVDFENSPKAVAKAADLTKNCKTNAEKITAIFEFVAKTIKYDDKATTHESEYRGLDDILTSKTGICVNYTNLMAGMLRSQGIPCKVVCGKAYEPGYDWMYHAWVSVSPDTKGLNMSRLGAGHDEDGWIRLDPTWASTGGTYGRSIAAIDKNHQTEYAY